MSQPNAQQWAGLPEETFYVPGLASRFPHIEGVLGYKAIDPNANTDRRIGSGRVFFNKFTPPNPSDSPSTLFRPATSANSIPCTRFLGGPNLTEILIYTDGACLNNGKANPKGGCAFVFGPVPANINNRLHSNGHCAFPLETQGPDGRIYEHTSNRAELRAVIAALRFRLWKGEGIDTIIIATDSEYVVEGATKWVRSWVPNKWRTSNRAPVKNRDLWENLLGEAERWEGMGVSIKFWRLPRNLNTEADYWAKAAAESRDVSQEYFEPQGFMLPDGMAVANI